MQELVNISNNCVENKKVYEKLLQKFNNLKTSKEVSDLFGSEDIKFFIKQKIQRIHNYNEDLLQYFYVIQLYIVIEDKGEEFLYLDVKSEPYKYYDVSLLSAMNKLVEKFENAINTKKLYETKINII